MLTYQIRPRIFRHERGEELVFPAKCVIYFHFQPQQPFGTEASGGHTFVRAVEASARFDANSGQHTIESKQPLAPLDVRIEGLDYLLQLTGSTLSLSEEFASLSEMEAEIQSVYFAFPSLINIPFADPPYIERVDGKVGAASFRWELDEWKMRFLSTTQQQQEERFAKAWDRMAILAESHRRRLAAALHYFHVACRLARVGATAGEFVAEVVLNLAKVLEALFSPGGDGRTRDAARAGLRKLGFPDDQIESNFLPAMALRNEIDVGHVELGLFRLEQLKTIHAFTERAESAFRDMFERLLANIEGGFADVVPHELGAPRDEAVKLIDRLQRYSDRTS